MINKKKLKIKIKIKRGLAHELTSLDQKDPNLNRLIFFSLNPVIFRAKWASQAKTNLTSLILVLIIYIYIEL